ncbi:MAG: hypothetical protein JWO13_2434 [Acidobacteriales bacterium]|nr:hypothetical protein [Terriglobales bacterium]
MRKSRYFASLQQADGMRHNSSCCSLQVVAGQLRASKPAGTPTEKNKALIHIEHEIGRAKKSSASYEVRKHGSCNRPGHHHSSAKNDNPPTPQRTRFTDVFVCRDGRWQVAAGHSSRIKERCK